MPVWNTLKIALYSSLAIHLVTVASLGMIISPQAPDTPPDPFELTSVPVPKIQPVKFRQNSASEDEGPSSGKADQDAEAFFKSQTDFLKDPLKKRIFIQYFAGIKQRIQNSLQKRYFREASTKGSIELFFIVRSNGTIERGQLARPSMSADLSLKRLAFECLKDAAPFKPFPSELDAERIAFNVTLNFDEF